MMTTDAERLQQLCTCDEPDRVERLRELLDAEKNPNASCLYDKTPLHWLVGLAKASGRDESSIMKDVDGTYSTEVCMLQLNISDLYVRSLS